MVSRCPGAGTPDSQSFLGFSLLMFGGTIWSLIHGRIRPEINKPMLSVAVLLLLLSTIVSSTLSFLYILVTNSDCI